jgi:long-subunit fatty acid transport protein
LSLVKLSRHWLGVGTTFAVVLAPSLGHAAGFDTPILYTARHQAMGGTAIASVDDASAGFHNPAGLQGIRGFGFIGDFSLILGKVRATPDVSAGNLESNTVKAPFFLLGAGYRLSDWLTLGLAGFPVASGGAEYHYDSRGTAILDKTEIVFFETTPMLSLNVPKDRILPGTLAFGAGYRFSYVTFDREKGEASNPRVLDLKLSGFDATGFRLGMQYRPIDAVKLGVVFRNKVTVTTKADSATVFLQEATNGELDFTLPAKLGFGTRVDWQRFGFGNDVEWAFQSQNKRPALKGTLQGTEVQVPNVFDWQNGITWRTGLEYRLGPGGSGGGGPSVPLRVGYIYDAKVTNQAYPSAFGTPPAPTRTLTAGAGFVSEHWQVNLAVSRRFGEAYVFDTDLGKGCNFCSFAGQYKITMTGLYIDASIDLPK